MTLPEPSYEEHTVDLSNNGGRLTINVLLIICSPDLSITLHFQITAMSTSRK